MVCALVLYYGRTCENLVFHLWNRQIEIRIAHSLYWKIKSIATISHHHNQRICIGTVMNPVYCWIHVPLSSHTSDKAVLVCTAAQKCPRKRRWNGSSLSAIIASSIHKHDKRCPCTPLLSMHLDWCRKARQLGERHSDVSWQHKICKCSIGGHKCN